VFFSLLYDRPFTFVGTAFFQIIYELTRQESGMAAWKGTQPAETGGLSQPGSHRSQSARREAQEGLGKRIRAMRKSKGWSQEVFARKCGIDLHLLGAIERGNQNFGLGTLLPIAANLDTTIAALFAGIA